MGKKKTATSTKNSATGPAPATSAKPKLAKKAVKAVAALAVGVGSAIASKRTRRKTVSKTETPNQALAAPQARPTRIPTHEEIAIRAYFISEQRRTAGLPLDPHRDWLDAERELLSLPPNHSA